MRPLTVLLLIAIALTLCLIYQRSRVVLIETEIEGFNEKLCPCPEEGEEEEGDEEEEMDGEEMDEEEQTQAVAGNIWDMIQEQAQEEEQEEVQGMEELPDIYQRTEEEDVTKDILTVQEDDSMLIQEAKERVKQLSDKAVQAISTAEAIAIQASNQQELVRAEEVAKRLIQEANDSVEQLKELLSLTTSIKDNQNLSLAMAAAFPEDVEAEDDQVVLYQFCNFKGHTIILEPGNYTMADLQALTQGLWDVSRAVPSFKVGSSRTLRIYQEDEFMGSNMEFVGPIEQSCFVSRDILSEWSNPIASLKVE